MWGFSSRPSAWFSRTESDQGQVPQRLAAPLFPCAGFGPDVAQGGLLRGGNDPTGQHACPRLRHKRASDTGDQDDTPVSRVDGLAGDSAARQSRHGLPCACRDGPAARRCAGLAADSERPARGFFLPFPRRLRARSHRAPVRGRLLGNTGATGGSVTCWHGDGVTLLSSVRLQTSGLVRTRIPGPLAILS